MKILITGKNSYIGNAFAAYCESRYADFVCEKISLRDNAWEQMDFSEFDAILHVAGLAHADTGKLSKKEQLAYYHVNRDLTYKVAKKAAKDGVKQFVFLSSIIVYGNSAPIGSKKVITAMTKPHPSDFYGDSKLQAEKSLLSLREKMKICIVRPPFVYGPGCKGNYNTLAKMAERLPVFPLEQNERSMIYVENLCEFLCLMMKNEESGIFCPQNNGIYSTSRMVKEIAKAKGKKQKFLPLFHPALLLFGKLQKYGRLPLVGKPIAMANKAFGSLIYEPSLSAYKEMYQKVDFTTSIRETEAENKSLQKKQKLNLPVTVSVVTVCYNAQNDISRTLNSVLAQQWKPDEYLIIDGASQDDTVAIAESYREKMEAAGIRYVISSEPDTGIYNAMNKGVQRANGVIVGILNAGDVYLPNAIARTVEVFARTGCDLTFGNIRIRKTDGTCFVKKAAKKRIQTSRNWNHPTMFVRTELSKEFPYLEKGIHDDYGFYLSMVAQGRKNEVIDETLAEFQMGGASNRKSVRESVLRIHDRYRYCYRENGFSRLYLIECIAIEAAKALLG